MFRKHIFLTIVLALTLCSGSVAFAEVNAVTPSTNELNKTYDPMWANVDIVDVGVGEVTLEFISERGFYSCFEYRTDGDTSQKTSYTNYNTLITDGLYPFYCQNNDSSIHTINANEYVEVRMVFGAETDERFDWTRFDVLPKPQISCNDDSGTFLEPFDRPIFFKGKKTNRNLPLKFSCVDESGVVVDDEYMASNGWAAPVVNVAFLASGGSTDPGFEADLVPGGLATDGNEFIYNGEYWMLVLGLKAYTAVGVYTISAVPGDSNYTMDVSETYQKLD